jgi:hypothetical protein
MTVSTKTDLNQVTASRRMGIDPALSDDLWISLPYPP